MRQLGYRELSEMDEIPEIEIKPDEMTRRKEKEPSGQDNQDPEFLKRRITLLEYRLREAELKATAYSTMIDIAEKELKISIRKK
jgi:transposase